MGTNYHIKENDCRKCGRFDEIHLGKNSWGWQFGFQYNGGQYYKNVEEMKAWLKGKQIWNEYDEKVSYEDFWKMVKAEQVEKNLNHASEHMTSYNRVIDGYSFTDCEFS